MDDINTKIEQLLYQLGQQGLLNDQFQQLLQLQDESNPDFVREVVELYFQDSAAKLDKLGAKVGETPTDFAEIDALVHQFKGSSASFGAQTIAQLCVQLREACHGQDQRQCAGLLEQVRHNYDALKRKLEVFIQLEQQRKVLTARGTSR